jgi:lipopolysaccharide/colanic/teichoic acid biosynthesis glycosyltransferase
MSFVDPRPLPLKYLERFTPKQAARHTVMPGMTGWTAIGYRGQGTTWDEKPGDDIWCVYNWSLFWTSRVV